MTYNMTYNMTILANDLFTTLAINSLTSVKQLFTMYLLTYINGENTMLESLIIPVIVGFSPLWIAALIIYLSDL